MTKTALSKIVADLLEDNALGTVGADLFYMAWGPSDIDAQTVIFDGQGFDSPLPETFEQPTIQISTRGKKDADAEDAYNMCRSIYEFLIQFDELIGDERIYFVPMGSLNALGRDDNTRPQFTMNFYAYRNSLT